MLFSFVLMAWLVVAIPFWIVRRKSTNASDITMLICAALVTLAIVTPDTFFG